MKRTFSILLLAVVLFFFGITLVDAQTTFIFSRTLRKGNSGAEVKKLQEILAVMPDVYPEKLVTGYFGVLTRQAVQRFQAKNGIVSSGDEKTTGYGLVGPKTRKKLNERAGSQAGISQADSARSPQATTTSSNSERKINSELCPNNTWDEAEQKDLNLCPEDNPLNNPKSVAAKIAPASLVIQQDESQASSSPSVSTTTSFSATSSEAEYQEFLKKLPNLPVIETWQFEYDAGSGGAFVPDIVEYNDKLYMYAYLPQTGIVSFSSPDGKQWTKDAGVRIAEGGKYSHPFASVAPNGKLYLFMQTGKEGVVFSVSRSESSDGISFTAPEPALKGSDFGSTHAAHGRIMKISDGTYLLAISSGINGRGPQPGTSLLYSSDLEKWNFKSAYFAGCHDPTFDETPGGIRLYCQYLGKQIVRFDSLDGYTWKPNDPAGLVEFLDQNGVVINAGDIDMHISKDGSKRIFISYNPAPPFGNIWSTVKK
ncbi:MAG: exo-alpha-sialidase [Parcubacteria group bacterium]|nr:exo-alpha-sialidase [Parcubacteria group bacterium]MBI3074936.1 exo-alpha-sialidase [Parcubacteria group bacterium]